MKVKRKKIKQGIQNDTSKIYEIKVPSPPEIKITVTEIMCVKLATNVIFFFTVNVLLAATINLLIAKIGIN